MQQLTILYEDNHLLAVVKPPGILSQEDDSGAPDMLTLLKADLKARYNKPGNVFLGLVHRLDRPVGGVMLFAKTSKAASRLSESIRSRVFDKTYAAVVIGRPSSSAGELRHYLVKDSRANIVQLFNSPVEGAKEALLDYTVLASDQELSLVSVKLHTGRPHQIRVQLAAIGCPLVGDRKYGVDQKYPHPADTSLWSTSIRTQHPVTKADLHFTSLPPDAEPWNRWPSELLRHALHTEIKEEVE